MQCPPFCSWTIAKPSATEVPANGGCPHLRLPTPNPVIIFYFVEKGSLGSLSFDYLDINVLVTGCYLFECPKDF